MKIIECNLNHLPKRIAQTLLEHRQAWSHGHFPGELVPVPDHRPSEKLIPNIQPTPSGPVTEHQREDRGTSHLAPPHFTSLAYKP